MARTPHRGDSPSGARAVRFEHSERVGFDTDPRSGRDVPRGAILAAPPFGEERLFAVVAAWQVVTDYHRARPADPSE